MLKYLIIQLDDTSVAFCQYPCRRLARNIMPLDILNKAIMWGMKRNLAIQVLYPDYPIPKPYKDVLSKAIHTDVASSECKDKLIVSSADILVENHINSLGSLDMEDNRVYVIRTTFDEFIEQHKGLTDIIARALKVNVIFTDSDSFTVSKLAKYSDALNELSDVIVECQANGKRAQFNLLTDRIMLNQMNNCNAGIESITLAPDGKFYICPAFYHDNNSSSVGDIDSGLNIPNSQLYELGNAPICRICDAWQCKRCVWLNQKQTLEVNTPGKEQCILAHIERNASKRLLHKLQFDKSFVNEIPAINYLDPFDVIKNNL